MSIKPNSKSDLENAKIFQIRVKGHLDSQWSDWFEGLTVTLDEDGTTLLIGPVVDDAALHGLLKKVRDSGLGLLSVNRNESALENVVDSDQSGDSRPEIKKKAGSE